MPPSPPAPIAVTVPATALPGTYGGSTANTSGPSPRRIRASSHVTPAAATATRTSPTAGSGVGSSTGSSTPDEPNRKL
ncbi:hypothetical protein ACPZ19_28740 [Amycolatopsis lurida]